MIEYRSHRPHAALYYCLLIRKAICQGREGSILSRYPNDSSKCEMPMHREVVKEDPSQVKLERHQNSRKRHQQDTIAQTSPSGSCRRPFKPVSHSVTNHTFLEKRYSFFRSVADETKTQRRSKPRRAPTRGDHMISGPRIQKKELSPC